MLGEPARKGDKFDDDLSKCHEMCELSCSCAKLEKLGAVVDWTMHQSLATTEIYTWLYPGKIQNFATRSVGSHQYGSRPATCLVINIDKSSYCGCENQGSVEWGKTPAIFWWLPASMLHSYRNGPSSSMIILRNMLLSTANCERTRG